MIRRIVIFSHGFGVRADSAGLFTDIITALPQGTETVTFDYGTYHREADTVRLPLVSAQSGILDAQLSMARSRNPGVPITVVAHSQGAVVSAHADLSPVERLLLLAPAWHFNAEVTDHFRSRPSVRAHDDGSMSMWQRDGSTLVIPPGYANELGTLDPIGRYNDWAQRMPVAILWAEEDSIIRQPPPGMLTPFIQSVPVPGDHNFTGTARADLVREVVRRAG